MASRELKLFEMLLTSPFITITRATIYPLKTNSVKELRVAMVILL